MIVPGYQAQNGWELLHPWLLLVINGSPLFAGGGICALLRHNGDITTGTIADILSTWIR